MWKTLLLVATALGAGAALAVWMQPAPLVDLDAAANSLAAVGQPTAGVSAARIEELEAALAAEAGARMALEDRVEELVATLDTLRGSVADSREKGEAPPEPGPPGPPDFVRQRLGRDPAALQADMSRRQLDRLIAAGFAPDRAEWITRRTSELRMEQLQAQYDAQREGRALDPGSALQGERALRTELGDTDYERYLTAMNRPTSVPVQGVLASSPAERLGLKAGDEVIAYDGQRVFDMRELNALTYEGTAGESVVVDVRRDGQTVQLVMPRGPIGIFGGGFRGGR